MSPQTCPNCRCAVTPQTSFCRHCGTRFASTDAGAVGPTSLHDVCPVPRYIFWFRWVLFLPAAFTGMILVPTVWDFFWSWCPLSEFYSHAVSIYALPYLPLVWAGWAVAPSGKGVVALILVGIGAVMGLSEVWTTVYAVAHRGYTWGVHDALAHIPLWSGVWLTLIGIGLALWFALAVFRPSRFATSAGVSRLAFRACVGLAVVLFIVQGVLADITSVGPHGWRVDGLGNRVYSAPSWSHLFGERQYWNGPRLFVVQRVSFFGTTGLLLAWSEARRKTEDDVNETDWESEA